MAEQEQVEQAQAERECSERMYAVQSMSERESGSAQAAQVEVGCDGSGPDESGSENPAHGKGE